MRKLLNTLFVTSDDLYLSLENGNIEAWKGKEKAAQIPLINLENILDFSHKGASPALLGECVKRGIGFCFLTPNGRFLARACGVAEGNIFLRKEQYRISDDEEKSLIIARAMITGKILNARSVLMRALRDHPLSVDKDLFRSHIKELQNAAACAAQASGLDELRGIEGNGAQSYFSLLDSLILQDKKHFYFRGRSKRPPLDRMNAILSFTYTILAHDCASALEAAGLDPYAGFLHRDRPGRDSLALDLMEELRSVYADRFALTLVNNRILSSKNFEIKEDGAVWLNGEGRKILLNQWQERKRDTITHPFLQEKWPGALFPTCRPFCWLDTSGMIWTAIRHSSGSDTMLLLVTYDVNTTTAAGRKRLRQVAKCCTAHGQRVQNSVFECSVDEAQAVALRARLKELIDEKADSLRFYNLGNHYQNKIIHIGAKKGYDPNDTMIL